MNRRLLPFQGWRLTAFQAVMFAMFLIFSIRMYDLQIVRNSEYQAAADENRLNELPIPAPRGVIFDRYNRPLAKNVPAFNVTVIPADLPNDTNQELQVFNRLSALVNVPPTIAAARAANRKVRSIEELVAEGEGIAPFRPVIVAQDVDFHVALQIKEERLSLPGVDVDPVSVREYPTGELTSHIIGYMAPIPAEQAQSLIKQGYNPAFDRIGVDGVEYFLDNILAGKRGSRQREVDIAGEEIRELKRIEPVPGQNVRLTLDTDLQAAAEEAVRNEITLINTEQKKIVSQEGVVIAMNPQTGEILAMVSWPSYDNSKFARAIDVNYYLDVVSDTRKPLVNNAIRSLYPPGSVWKLVSATGVLQENVIAPTSALFDSGRLVVENRYAPNDKAAAQTFVCWDRKGHGEVDMLRGIAQSCDVYFYQVGGGNPEVSPSILRPGGLGITDLFRYATALGIGSELGIELPSENPGRMPDQDWKRIRYGENWSTGDTYNAAFGQGYVSITPLQLISAVSAIANGGTLYQPTIIKDILDAEGNVVQPFTPHVLRTVSIDDTQGPLTLLLLEDMIMKGPSSLACTCEEDSPYYNGVRCNAKTYRNQVNVSPDPLVPIMRDYQVLVPFNYVFNGSVCSPNRFDQNYRPPFVSKANMKIIEEGMRDAVLVGTAKPANLTYINVAGKTGTAEYCDDIARPLGLCIPGKWPSHAWFTAYAPYEKPEILVIGFVYNGGEGSAVALPVVRKVIEAYVLLQSKRNGLPPPQTDDTFPTQPTPAAVSTPIPQGG
jgi:penicillin-binding protein 2